MVSEMIVQCRPACISLARIESRMRQTVSRKFAEFVAVGNTSPLPRGPGRGIRHHELCSVELTNDDEEVAQKKSEEEIATVLRCRGRRLLL